MGGARERLTSFYQELISLKGEPRPIAMGMAMGVFVGVTPTIPFHTILIIVLGVLFRQNITSAFLGSCLISNPVTIPVFYLAEYKLGRLLLGYGPLELITTDFSILAITEMGGKIIVPLLTGGVVIAALFAIPVYFIAYRFISVLHQRRRP